MKRKKKIPTKITLQDYVKAVKKADRDIELSQTVGWHRITKIHKSQKAYDRKTYKRNIEE